MANTAETPRLVRWARLALAGMAVGFNVMEGADNGAIFSLFVAAFVFIKSLAEDNGPALIKIGRGIARVAMIAFFAAFIAAQTIISLVGTYIVGTAGMQQDKATQSSQEHWDWATQWSLPKKETLGIFVPGLFGYRMDTPKDMMGFLRGISYQGGLNIGGGMGRTPEIDRWFDGGEKGQQPSGPTDWMRFGYAGFYCGILVGIVALFGMVQSWRGPNSIFQPLQRHLIWYWIAVLVIALLLAWGRFAPFYHFIYVLPYFSTIRNPAKFMAIFYLAIIIIFGFTGMMALCRRYLLVPAGKFNSWLAQFKNWRTSVKGFDRNWSLFLASAFGISVVAWLIYMSSKESLVKYLKTVGFPDDEAANAIASFSIGQAGWFILFFGASVGLVILVMAGVFSGKRARLGGFLLGALLVVDLGRADLPWIIHWDYKQKYASNYIIDLLKDKAYEHRVGDIRSDSPFEQLYRIEWMQHHFPYYNIQCLDIIQSPRVSSDLMAYDIALSPSPSSIYLVYAPLATLSNTSYLLGPAGYLDSLNEQLDPGQHQFRIVQRFSIAPKPGIEHPTELEQITAVPDNNGDYALFEYDGALPRAKLYSNWQVSTNDDETLKTLAAQNFNPEKTVLVSTALPAQPTGGNTGTVEIASYTPKKIVLNAQANDPSVLLYNDRYDANWHVLVDGKPAELLHCNYIMRGVFLPAGTHTVEFQFYIPNKPLYITLTAIILGIILCGVLYVCRRQPAEAAR